MTTWRLLRALVEVATVTRNIYLFFLEENEEDRILCENASCGVILDATIFSGADDSDRGNNRGTPKHLFTNKASTRDPLGKILKNYLLLSWNLSTTYCRCHTTVSCSSQESEVRLFLQQLIVVVGLGPHFRDVWCLIGACGHQNVPPLNKLAHLFRVLWKWRSTLHSLVISLPKHEILNLWIAQST